MKKELDRDLNILFSNVNDYVIINIKETPLAIEDLTEYYINHLFCDFQTFISCISFIKDIEEVYEVSYFENKICVKIENKEDIGIELNNFRISILLFGIIKPTPIETVEKIMNIFKSHIDSLIDTNKKIYIRGQTS